MTSMRKRTMRGSVAARDALVNSITNLYSVAETDVTDIIAEDLDPMLERERRRFVEALVDRMLFDDDILLDWIGEEQDDDKPWNDTGEVDPHLPHIEEWWPGKPWDGRAPIRPGDRVKLTMSDGVVLCGVVQVGASRVDAAVRVLWDGGEETLALVAELEPEVQS